MKSDTNKFGAIFNESFTKSFENFSSENIQSDLLITLMQISGDYIENNKNDVREKILEIAEDLDNDTIQKWNKIFKSEKGDVIINIDSYQDFYGQMCFARIIDNFQMYVKEILAEVIEKQPMILKSKDVERLDYILSHESMDCLYSSLAEKKAKELFYKGIEEIEKYFQDRLGIVLFKNQDEKSSISQAIKYRNLIVHNRGRVTKEFLRLFPETGIQEGDYLHISFGDLSALHVELNNFVAKLDAEIAEKFGLNCYTRKY